MADAGGPTPLTWRWSSFLLGSVYALPALVVGAFSPMLGLALAVGVLPVAAFPLPPRRRGRKALPVIGALSAASFVVGALLAPHPVVAVVALFVLAVGAGLWAREAPLGRVAMTSCVPLIGIGLSFDDLATAVVAAALILVGSVYAWGVSLFWPERVASPPAPASVDRRWLLAYAFLLGAVGAVAAAVGFALHLEHVGWVTGAALLVMRPAWEQLLLRSAGRAVSVTAGAFAAAALGTALGTGEGSASGPTAVVAVAAGLALAALAATAGSRWYVAPAFTTFVVLTFILAMPGEQPASRFIERVVETLVGVGIALALGVLLPALVARARAGRS